ncbi:hypothetical protein XAP412_230076 [Xanthomonas phaseoli pv. phaseoli]|uniref:Uncharacterized protein n=1 Tax=Xanthomonas campestris pv. phaseoli TaxID=317013 RepID=A0AB38DXL9_XANCH|nr:hypothetical protein XAP6984_300076 [Xanthomonas phaseoli pv. phaseoli]SON81953.1 hypothetical protein XAP412_230076 [Xanthomonas phaseoli pv. phaseoli]SON86028.1 hypothetical protein XAP7430_250077 [Xanthomonas phaseoli pv. phaseoli]SOO32359.1 hypothetical protein XAP6164_900002 [Xanthomonas phaseoli pv. phaseoli]
MTRHRLATSRGNHPGVEGDATACGDGAVADQIRRLLPDPLLLTEPRPLPGTHRGAPIPT